jgi:hypothetical protein
MTRQSAFVYYKVCHCTYDVGTTLEYCSEKIMELQKEKKLLLKLLESTLYLSRHIMTILRVMIAAE